MKEIRYDPRANEEMLEAAFWYDDQQPGLGIDFISAIEHAERMIRETPSIGGLSEAGTRTKRVKRFPFGIVYKEYPDYIFVYAISHFSRKPGYWKDRVR